MSSSTPAASSDAAKKPDAPVSNGVSADSSKDADDDALPTDGGATGDDIHAKLRALRLDEVPGLSQSPTNKRTIAAGDSYTQLVILETTRYLRYVAQTLVYVVGTFLFGGLGPFDFLTILVFAVGGIVVLGIVLIFCLAAQFPILVDIYFKWSEKYGGGLGLVNSGNPNLFKSLTPKQAEAAKEALSASFEESGDSDKHRYFNLDAAKLLLQIASVIYEHECDAIRKAVNITSTAGVAKVASTVSAAVSDPTTTLSHGPGELLSNLWSPRTSNEATAALDSDSDQAIRDFVASFGLDFEPISELNNTSSAFAGLFWDPESNWIVVSFKGTAPLEFGEWLSDLNTKLVDCGDSIVGYSKCHFGFKERVFPRDVSTLGNFRPYDTIALGVKTLAKWLHKKNGFPKEKKINVWYTGHSLGCATASLVYSRMLMHEKDIGKHAVLRDAYLFAAPILTDRPSVDVFNNKMNEKKHELKTMWRITSNGDFVATCLPELGDYRDLDVSPNNAFAFAHLGTELIMKDHPLSNNVTGCHILYGSPVSIKSKFTAEEIAAQRAEHLAIPGEAKREQIGVLLQKIPLLGRFLAHLTVFYWDQLDRIGIGKCDWSVY